MQLARLEFDHHTFLKEYWQQKPVLLKGLLSPFNDLLDEHDLAGIAQEQDADTRIVTRNDAGQWTNTSGPFDDFSKHCIGYWSLLVQGVEKYIPEVDDLFEAFSFVPYWRMDDVMVSYSVPGAGVGAHIDQYDVFLIQGKGIRSWQVGEPGGYSETDNNGLLQVSDFKPVIDIQTHSGDVLYIPPGWPHKGETIEDSLTYSIGYRAPDADYLCAALHESILLNKQTNKRFQDIQRAAQSSKSMITREDMQALKDLLHQAIDSECFENQLIEQLSESQSATPSLDTPYSIEDVKHLLLSGAVLRRVEGVRPLYTEPKSGDLKVFVYSVNGEVITCCESLQNGLLPILENTEFTLTSSDSTFSDPLFEQVAYLINQGYWYIE
jgi:50S ribosomal protein L16 3-hydroxylase